MGPGSGFYQLHMRKLAPRDWGGLPEVTLLGCFHPESVEALSAFCRPSPDPALEWTRGMEVGDSGLSTQAPPDPT